MTREAFQRALELAPARPVALCPELQAHQAQDVYSVWAATEGQGGLQSPPFWAAVWPGAALLARVLLDQPERVAGQRVWDIGCGGGVAAIGASRAGAREVVANDVDLNALWAAEANAALNGVALRYELGDWTDRIAALGGGETLLVAEMFYERTAAARLQAALHQAIAAGARVLIADGGRPFAPAPTGTLLREATLPVPHSLEGVHERATRVFEMHAPSSAP